VLFDLGSTVVELHQINPVRKHQIEANRTRVWKDWVRQPGPHQNRRKSIKAGQVDTGGEQEHQFHKWGATE
jgi:hypothetical protein